MTDTDRPFSPSAPATAPRATLPTSAAPTSLAPVALAHEAATPWPTTEQVVARLTRSRERLRESLTPPPAPAEGAEHGGFHPLRQARAWLRTTPWGGLLDPVVSALSDEVMHWWQRQSWRHSVLLAKDTLSAELSPLVRRHPIAAVLLTAAAGATVAASGVWQWHTVRHSAWQLGSRLRRGLVGQLANPALLSVLLGALISTLAANRKPTQADQAPNAPQPPA